MQPKSRHKYKERGQVVKANLQLPLHEVLCGDHLSNRVLNLGLVTESFAARDSNSLRLVI